MGLFKRLFGGKQSNLAETIKMTKLFIGPQLLTLEKENIRFTICNKSLVYIVAAAEILGGHKLQLSDVDRLLMSVSDVPEVQERFRKSLVLILDQPSLFTGVYHEMHKEAHLDINNDNATFLIDQAKTKKRIVAAMFKKGDYVPTPFDRGGGGITLVC